jgi:hypothetical protein
MRHGSGGYDISARAVNVLDYRIQHIYGSLQLNASQLPHYAGK